MTEYLVDLTATLTARVQADSPQAAVELVQGWNAEDPASLPLTEITAHVAKALEGDGESAGQPELFQEAEDRLRDAYAAAYGDSNDGEIDAWRDFGEVAASLLGIKFWEFRDRAYAEEHRS